MGGEIIARTASLTTTVQTYPAGCENLLLRPAQHQQFLAFLSQHALQIITIVAPASHRQGMRATATRLRLGLGLGCPRLAAPDVERDLRLVERPQWYEVSELFGFGSRVRQIFQDGSPAV